MLNGRIDNESSSLCMILTITLAASDSRGGVTSAPAPPPLLLLPSSLLYCVRAESEAAVKMDERFLPRSDESGDEVEDECGDSDSVP